MAIETNPLVLDIGAHKGLTSAYYLERGFNILAIEAHPQLARMLSQRFHLHPQQARVLHWAITPSGDASVLFVSDKGTEGETHSIFPHRVKRCEAEGYTVPGTTIGRLLTAYGVPHYMKVDIEGADVVAIRQLHAWQQHSKNVPPAYLSVELCWESPEEVLEIFSHLAYMGYDLFRLADQFNPEGGPKVVPIQTDPVYYYRIEDVVSDWFDGPPMAGHWYDLHARHSLASGGSHDA